MHLVIPHQSLLLATLAAVVLVLICVSIAKALSRMDDDTRAMVEELQNEDVRVAALPKLDTQYLLPVPKGFETEALGNHSGESQRRTFNIRGKFLFVINENGDEFVGPVLPRTLRGLVAGEYVERKHFVPLCGSGQKFNGRAVDIDGQHFDVYPMWLAKGGYADDWHIWSHLMGEFSRAFICENNHLAAIHRILPATTHDRLSAERKRVDELRAAVAARTSIRA